MRTAVQLPLLVPTEGLPEIVAFVDEVTNQQDLDAMDLSGNDDLLITFQDQQVPERVHHAYLQEPLEYLSPPDDVSLPTCRTKSRTDLDRNNSSTMLIHELSFTLNQNFTETLSAVTTLVTLYNDVLFQGTFAPKVSSLDELTLLITTAWDEFSKSAMEERAVLDSTGFILPDQARISDITDLIRVGSLAALIDERQRSAAPERFNIDRCNEYLSDVNPEDLARLRDIATNGSQVPLPDDFQRQAYPNDMRSIAHKLGNTFEKYGYKLWLEGRVLLLPLSQLALYDCDTLNFSCDAWWVGAPGKPAGRMLIDPSNASEGNPVLNTPEVKLVYEQLYGVLKLTSIKEILRRAIAYCELNGFPLEVLRLWKLDVKNAFGVPKIRPSHASYLAIRISEDTIMIHLNGQFGVGGQPIVYGPFSRATLEALRPKLSGVIDVYVDDYIGIAEASKADPDMVTAKSFLLGVLGPDGLSPKDVPPTSAGEILGWLVDFTAGTIRPSDRAIRKLALVFLTLDISSSNLRWSLHTCQVLASLSERYSHGILGMRPFVQPFIKLTNSAGDTTVRSAKAKRRVSSEAIQAVVMWRPVIVLMLTHPEWLAVPISAFIRDPSSEFTHSFITDAADSVGLSIYCGATLIGCTTYLLPFNAHDSRFQNTREFLGITLGLLLLKRRFNLPRGTKIGIKSDSMSAISWVMDNKGKSEYAHVAFLAYSWILIQTGYEISAITHIAGASEEMFNIDALSRNRATVGLDLSTFIQTSAIERINELFRLCNPNKDDECITKHLATFEKVIRCVSVALDSSL